MRNRRILSVLVIPALGACSSTSSFTPAGESTSPEVVSSGSAAEALEVERRDNDGHGDHRRTIEHVILLSIDGLHSVDLETFIAGHPASALAKLAHHGVRYTRAFVNRLAGKPSNPTDSYPGLLALTTGGSSPTTGGWYDVAYARDLFAFSSTSPCGGAPGTAVVYDESIDVNNAFLWGSQVDDKPTHEVATLRTRINATLLPYVKKGASCTPVYPHQYVRTNTIFNVAKRAHLHTAWSDKHLSYELVSGPTGDGLDDFFAPEINSDPSNSLIPSVPPGGAFTDNWQWTETYDDYKVNAILNEINGQWSDQRLPGATDTAGHPGVPSIFGMNFQAVSVAQKSAAVDGGYVDAAGTPGAQVADAMMHTDASIGKMVDELREHRLLDKTAIIVTAKHGQSPIDKTLVRKVDPDAVVALIEGVAPIAGHIEDDVGLYWLKDPSTARAAAAALLSPPAGGVDPLADVVMTTSTDSSFVSMFGDPRLDPHTPDVVVKLQHGVIYSLSKKKNEEHGGFADDDAHVGLLVSHPSLEGRTSDDEVQTKQVAPTILKLLGLDPQGLDAVRIEGTAVLPDLL